MVSLPLAAEDRHAPGGSHGAQEIREGRLPDIKHLQFARYEREVQRSARGQAAGCVDSGGPVHESIQLVEQQQVVAIFASQLIGSRLSIEFIVTGSSEEGVTARADLAARY